MARVQNVEWSRKTKPKGCYNVYGFERGELIRSQVGETDGKAPNH
jgi:hypothetical protein